MQKSDIVKKISKKLSVPLKDVKNITDAYEEVIKESLIKGLNIDLRGFLSFELRVQKEKTYIDLQTQEKKIRPKHYALRIKIARNFNEAIKSKTIY